MTDLITDNKEVVRRFMRAWEAQPLADGEQHLAPGATAWLAHAAGASGLEANLGTQFSLLRWLELLDPIVTAMPGGLTVRIHNMVAEDDWVVVDTESAGVIDESARYNMRYTFWFRVVDGAIAELKQFFDTKYGEQFFLNRHFEHESDTPESGDTVNRIG